MYVTVEPKQIKGAVSALQSVAGSKTQQPILQQVLLQAEAAQIIARASNEEMSVRYRLPATVQAPGSVLVPASLFASLVQDLPQAPLTIVVPCPTDATAAQLRCRNIHAKVKQGAIPMEEFPRYPEPGQPLLTIDGELLREVIDQVAYAAATHGSSRPVMEGISLIIGEGQASFAAADAFRLAFRRLAVPDPQVRANLILPAHALRSLARLLPSNGSVCIALSVTGSQVLFHMPQVDVALRLMAGTFPAYGTLLASQPSTRVVVPTQVLAEAMRLTASFTRENGHQLRLHITPAMPGEAAALVLEAQAPDLGTNTIRIEEAVTVDGTALTLLVQDGLLAEALAVVPTREVVLELTDARHPLAIKPASSLAHASVIMPLVVQPRTPAPAQQASGVTEAA